MARSSIETRLSLDRYAQLMGLNRYHFNNLDDGEATSATRPYWTQTMHDDMAHYIARAEALMRDGVPESGKVGLGFDVGPAWRTNERIPFTPYPTQSWWLSNAKTKYGYLQSFGTRAVTALESDATVSFSGDGATITVSGVSSSLDPAQVQVFYRTADGAGATADPGWRIGNLYATVSGTTLTITGHKASFAKLDVLSASGSADADGSNYVTAVDVYRVYPDTELPVTLVWDRYGEGLSGDPTTNVTQTGAARLVDSRQGIFQPRPATYSSGSHAFANPEYTSAPEWLIADYEAGYDPPYAGRDWLDPRLEIAVTRLANVLTPDFVPWLGDLAKTKWRDDREGPTRERPLQPGEEDCPFGLSEGARYAWRVVREMRLYRSPF